MCQAPVGRVIETNKDRIVVEYKGKRRELRSKLVDVSKGDYVLFSVDIAIEKIDPIEAQEILGSMR
jgi:hydrogenase maturation factor